MQIYQPGPGVNTNRGGGPDKNKIKLVYNTVLKIKDNPQDMEQTIFDIYCNNHNLNKDDVSNITSLFLLDKNMSYQQIIGEYNNTLLMEFLGNHGFVFIT